jgi:nitronate monooxygenase
VWRAVFQPKLPDIRGIALPLSNLEAKVPGSFGYNLIVNKSNIKYKDQLAVLCAEKVDFIITSLGSPEETIKAA